MYCVLLRYSQIQLWKEFVFDRFRTGFLGVRFEEITAPYHHRSTDRQISRPRRVVAYNIGRCRQSSFQRYVRQGQLPLVNVEQNV